MRCRRASARRWPAIRRKACRDHGQDTNCSPAMVRARQRLRRTVQHRRHGRKRLHCGSPNRSRRSWPELVKPAGHLVKPAGHLGAELLHLTFRALDALVHVFEALVHALEAPLHLGTERPQLGEHQRGHRLGARMGYASANSANEVDQQSSCVQPAARRSSRIPAPNADLGQASGGIGTEACRRHPLHRTRWRARPTRRSRRRPAGHRGGRRAAGARP